MYRIVSLAAMITLLCAACGDEDGPRAICDQSLDLNPLGLASDSCVSARFELTGTPSALNVRDGSLWTYTMAATPPFASEVLSWSMDATTGKLGASTPVFSFTPTTSAATLFAGGYLALSPGGFAAVGYTEDQTFDGEIFWGDQGIATPRVVSKASGNFDAIFIDDQTLLVNGSGVGSAQDGQGVYLVQDGKPARLLIEQMGSFSGFMALGESVVFAGGFFDTSNRMYGFSLAEIRAAISSGSVLSSSADGDLIHEGSMQSATAMGDDLIVAAVDENYAFSGVKRIPVSVNGDSLAAQAAQELVTPGGSAAVLKVAGSGNQLALLLTGDKTELALVQEQ